MGNQSLKLYLSLTVGKSIQPSCGNIEQFSKRRVRRVGYHLMARSAEYPFPVSNHVNIRIQKSISIMFHNDLFSWHFKLDSPINLPVKFLVSIADNHSTANVITRLSSISHNYILNHLKYLEI